VKGIAGILLRQQHPCQISQLHLGFRRGRVSHQSLFRLPLNFLILIGLYLNKIYIRFILTYVKFFIIFNFITFQSQIGHRTGPSNGINSFTFVFSHILLLEAINSEPCISFGISKIDSVCLFDWLIISCPSDCGLRLARVFCAKFCISTFLTQKWFDRVRETWCLLL